MIDAEGGANPGQRDAVAVAEPQLAADRLEVLQRRVQDLLHDGREPVNFVDEQNVVRLQVGQQRRQFCIPFRRPSLRMAKRGSRRNSHERLPGHPSVLLQ